MLKKVLTAIRHLFSRIATSDSGTEFIAYARTKLTEQNKTHADGWQLGKEQGWSADMRKGVIVFKFAKGVTGTAHFQVIGTYDEIGKRFTWGWAHASLDAAFKEHANLARQWGLDNQHPSFMAKSIACSLEEIWDFAAVTNALASSKAVYRGHAGTKYIFLTMGEMVIETNVAASQPNADAPHWSAIAKS
ncbi:MAG: hypothetical protein Q7T62_07680 [Undibacterium sp.]|nr:hypothetical protein [Undibacterium sp.]